MVSPEVVRDFLSSWFLSEDGEGMQIALFAVVNLLRRELKHHPIASPSCQLTFTGQNLQAFPLPDLCHDPG
jgi:hypothetical protein